MTYWYFSSNAGDPNCPVTFLDHFEIKGKREGKTKRTFDEVLNVGKQIIVKTTPLTEGNEYGVKIHCKIYEEACTIKIKLE
jgi:hypothetical protein